MWRPSAVASLLLLAAASTVEGAGRSGSLLQAEVDAAIASGRPATVSASGGDYWFKGASLVVANAAHLRIVVVDSPSIATAAADSDVATAATPPSLTLWFDCGSGVHIANSSDVLFQGFTIDYTAPCFAQGTVVALPTSSDDNPATETSRLSPESIITAIDIDFDVANFPAPVGPLFPAAVPVPTPPVAVPLNRISVKVIVQFALIYVLHGLAYRTVFRSCAPGSAMYICLFNKSGRLWRSPVKGFGVNRRVAAIGTRKHSSCHLHHC